jgi:hypothetical protein
LDGRAVEYKEPTLEQLFAQLLRTSRLRYVYVGMKEGPQLEQGQMSVATFPFSEGPLITSAFRGAEEWEMRRGPVSLQRA